MPRDTTPLSDEQRQQILDLHAAGNTRNDIAREVGRSGSTVTKVVHDAGLTFDRTDTEAATKARRADLAERRTQALDREMQILEAAQEHVLEVVVSKSRKHKRIIKAAMGADQVTELDFLPADDARNLANARSSSVGIIAKLTDNDAGAEAAKSILVGLAEAIGVTGPGTTTDDA